MTKLTKEDKCIITTDEKDRFLILIDSQDQENLVAGLPIKPYINSLAIAKSEITNIVDGVILINTHQEIAPWNLLDPFPPEEYGDYGYIRFNDKSGEMASYWPSNPENKTIHRYWDLLNSEDKLMVEAFMKTL